MYVPEASSSFPLYPPSFPECPALREGDRFDLRNVVPYIRIFDKADATYLPDGELEVYAAFLTFEDDTDDGTPSHLNDFVDLLETRSFRVPEQSYIGQKARCLHAYPDKPDVVAAREKIGLALCQRILLCRGVEIDDQGHATCSALSGPALKDLIEQVALDPDEDQPGVETCTARPILPS